MAGVGLVGSQVVAAARTSTAIVSLVVRYTAYVDQDGETDTFPLTLMKRHFNLDAGLTTGTWKETGKAVTMTRGGATFYIAQIGKNLGLEKKQGFIEAGTIRKGNWYAIRKN